MSAHGPHGSGCRNPSDNSARTRCSSWMFGIMEAISFMDSGPMFPSNNTTCSRGRWAAKSVNSLSSPLGVSPSSTSNSNIKGDGLSTGEMLRPSESTMTASIVMELKEALTQTPNRSRNRLSRSMQSRTYGPRVRGISSAVNVIARSILFIDFGRSNPCISRRMG